MTIANEGKIEAFLDDLVLTFYALEWDGNIMSKFLLSLLIGYVGAQIFSIYKVKG